MRLLSILLLGLFIVACDSKKPETTEAETAEVETEELAETETPKKKSKPQRVKSELEKQLVGYYIGKFEADKTNKEYIPSYFNKINVSIDSLYDDTLYGHSVVSGNDRPFMGAYTKQEDGTLTATCSEPGDDRYDGVFSFTIHPEEQRVSGTWLANNKAITVYGRKYDLKRAEFAYDPNNRLSNKVAWTELFHPKPQSEDGYDGWDFESVTGDVTKFNPSTDTLKPENLENMYKGDLEILRNSIYARHGYSFKNRAMRYIFDKLVDWYVPVSTDVREQLTTLEYKNIELIKRYEQHAERYYDVYGR